MKVSRRSVLALAGAGVAFPNAIEAQAPPPVSATEGAADPVAVAREENRQAAETLAKFEIAMSTEPAFIFRASS